MDNNRGKLKLKDTKLGEWFRNKAPQTLDAIIIYFDRNWINRF